MAHRALLSPGLGVQGGILQGFVNRLVHGVPLCMNGTRFDPRVASNLQEEPLRKTTRSGKMRRWRTRKMIKSALGM